MGIRVLDAALGEFGKRRARMLCDEPGEIRLVQAVDTDEDDVADLRAALVSRRFVAVDCEPGSLVGRVDPGARRSRAEHAKRKQRQNSSQVHGEPCFPHLRGYFATVRSRVYSGRPTAVVPISRQFAFDFGRPGRAGYQDSFPQPLGTPRGLGMGQL